MTRDQKLAVRIVGRKLVVIAAVVIGTAIVVKHLENKIDSASTAI